MAIFKINNVEVTKDEFYTTCFSSAPSSFTATISTPLTHITNICMSKYDKETRQEKEKLEAFRKKALLLIGDNIPTINKIYQTKTVNEINELTPIPEGHSTRHKVAKITPKANEQERKVLEDWERKLDIVEKNLGLKERLSIEIEGKKESNGKLFYEFDWEFIEAAAKRMQANKGKYEPFNWTKKIDVTELLQALNRHHIEVMKGNYDDGEEKLGHILSYFCNAMMIWHQLKNHR